MFSGLLSRHCIYGEGETSVKKWVSLFLVFAILFSFAACFAEDTEPEQGDGSGTVIFFDEAESGKEIPGSIVPTEPHAPAELEKAVIGADNRVTVSNTSQWPYSTIALMDVTAECGCTWYSSGFLVSDTGLFLTAAHCLICTDHSCWADNIIFNFGYKSRKNVYYKYTGAWQAYVGNLFSDKEYTTNKDYAVVKIDRRVPRKVGSLGAYWADSDSDLRNRYAYVAGYRDGKLRYDSGFLNILDDDHISFQMDEVSGNSGGPIYTSDGYAIGIIIAETTDEKGNPVRNVGYRLNYELWEKADEYSKK